MAKLTLPGKIYCGEGSVGSLKKLKGSRAFVVAEGCRANALGLVNKVAGFLEEAGMETTIFDSTEMDNSTEVVISAAHAMQEFRPDWIVSIGSSSSINACKAMWVLYEYPDTTFEQMAIPFNFTESHIKSKLAIIPSTSETASEVATSPMITDRKKGVKYPLAVFSITPSIAILDPEFSFAVSKPLTAHMGMDVLTHAVEAYVSTRSGPSTDPLALNIIGLVFDNLLDSYNGDENACGNMHYAHYLAEMSFSSELLGVVHSMTHKTSEMYSVGHIPHGCANAIYLPYIIQFNAPAAENRYAEIARYVGIEGNNDEELTGKFCAQIGEISKALEIPTTLKELGISEAEFNEKLSAVAENAVGDACTGSDPRPITPAQMEKLFTCIYHGLRVTIE